MPNGGQEQQPGGWNRVVLRVADLPACIAANAKWSGKQIQLEDPDGNPVERVFPRDAGTLAVRACAALRAPLAHKNVERSC